ncbi:MAG: bifunctional transaldolase/phosoglucose isomerase [Pyrinomonadaceae bacterium]
MLNKMTYSLPPELSEAFAVQLAAWQENGYVSKIWNKEADLWTDDDESKWLGWLDVAERESRDLDKYRELRRDIADAGFADVLLMGMGGSSLCPEVLAITFGVENFHVLDSTVPAQVKAVEDAVDLEKTLFIVASKSGSTLEPNCFKQYFFERVAERVGRENAGRQFVAITDPGSKMEEVARADGFRHIFYGDPEIGGRFSALSVFGMAAAAAMGLDVGDLLARSIEMVDACRTTDAAQNPGAMLGLILGVAHSHGRDKLTIFTSPEIYDLGAWLEQLIAESTGKRGTAIIPVDREPVFPAETYGGDRLFVYLRTSRPGLATLAGEDEKAQIQMLDAIRDAGHPFVLIELDDVEDLGQEFFRWEFATAVAGSIMGINPFNQPDVEAAKIEARKLTAEYEATGALPAEVPFFEADGIRLFTSEEYAAELSAAVDEPSLASLIEAHLLNIQEHDYFALLAYVEMNRDNDRLLQSIREAVLESHGVATCLGFGPRFLHSTGQAYKGGGNNGVFLQVTSDDAFDIPVPGQQFTFGVVKAAQARGDFQVLLDRGRRALRVHLGKDVAGGLEKLNDLVGDHS